MARLDRLGAAKSIAQVASALGREFSQELLFAVARTDEAALSAALDKLVDAGLLFRRGAAGDATYLFKHALIQDVAYGTLLRQVRRDLHARIARTLGERFPHISETQPEILAHHYFEAALSREAIEWRIKAGERALRRSALREAVQQFRAGLNLLKELPDVDDRAKNEIELQTGLGVALTGHKGYAALETGQAYTRARQLCEETGNTTTLVRVGYGQYLYHLMAGEVRRSYEVARETLDLAERLNSDDARVLGHRTLGVSLFELGQLSDARRELTLAADLVASRKKSSKGQSTSETETMISTWLAFLLTFQGYLDDAVRTREIALTQAHASAIANTRAFSMGFGTCISCLLGDLEDFLERARSMDELAREQDLQMHKGVSLMFLGVGHMMAGDINARTIFWNGLSRYRETGGQWALPLWLGLFVAALPSGDQEKVAALTQAFDAVGTTQERWYEAELYRLKGDMARLICSIKEAEDHYMGAKRIARVQGNTLLDLRASISLASLWRDQGRNEQACNMLGSVYSSFSQGFDKPVLREAREFLDAVVS